MLKEIKIKNFQSHKNTNLRFSSGVNVIVGSSDSGKSAIIRSMLWAIFNKPGGESFRSKWGGDTSLDIEIENDILISRKKGKKNEYLVNGNSFNGFGMSVPEKISKILNISNINVQRQMDAPFFLSSSPGEIGRELNKAVKLEVIDKSLKKVRSYLKNQNKSLTTTQEIIASKKEKIKDYSWLSKAEKNISILRSKSSLISKISGQAKEIKKNIEDLNDLNLQIKEKEKILTYEQRVERLISLNQKIKNQTYIYSSLMDLKQSIDDNKSRINDMSQLVQSEKLITKITKINREKLKTKSTMLALRPLVLNIVSCEKQMAKLSEIVQADKKTNKLVTLNIHIVEKNKEYQALVDIAEDIEKQDEELNIKKDAQIKLQKEFNLKMPSECPLCGR